MKIKVICQNEFEKEVEDYFKKKIKKVFTNANAEITESGEIEVKFELQTCKFCQRKFVRSKQDQTYCKRLFTDSYTCQQYHQYLTNYHGKFTENDYGYDLFIAKAKEHQKRLNEHEYKKWIKQVYTANAYWQNNVLPKKQFEKIINTPKEATMILEEAKKEEERKSKKHKK